VRRRTRELKFVKCCKGQEIATFYLSDRAHCIATTDVQDIVGISFDGEITSMR
jgi:hypothetical protein